MVESLLKEFPNVLTLRVRMPIVPDLTYARNFIAKVRRGGGGVWLLLVVCWGPYFSVRVPSLTHLCTQQQQHLLTTTTTTTTNN